MVLSGLVHYRTQSSAGRGHSLIRSRTSWPYQEPHVTDQQSQAGQGRHSLGPWLQGPEPEARPTPLTTDHLLCIDCSLAGGRGASAIAPETNIANPYVPQFFHV